MTLEAIGMRIYGAALRSSLPEWVANPIARFGWWLRYGRNKRVRLDLRRRQKGGE